MQQCDLIVKANYILTMDDSDTRIRDGAVAVDAGRILEVGKADDILQKYEAKETVCHDPAVIMPGLVNAHMHETLTRGLHEDLPLMRWLEEVCYPIEGSYIPDDMTAAAMMCQMEMIRAGITTFIDIFRFVPEAVAAARQTGLRAIFSPQFFDATQDTLESIDRTVDLILRFDHTENDRIRIWFGPHAPYTVGPESYARAARLAKELGVGVHTHLCETKSELQIVKERYGTTPVRMLEDAGVFDVPCVMAHCVHLTDDEIRFLASKRDTVGMVYNPISNMKLADGVARIPEILKAGCTLGLGTDSNLSNNGFDMFNEMRIGSYLQKTYNDDPTICPCGTMLRIATRGSAAALKMEDRIGSLEKGKCADLIVIDLGNPHLWPVYYENPCNIPEQIVYSCRAGDVITTVVDGKVLMDDRTIRTVDQASLFETVQNCAHALYRRSFPDRF